MDSEHAWSTMDLGRRLDPDFDRVLFHSAHLTVGSFRAAAGHRRFSDSGPAAHHLFVFPRTSVGIQHEGAAPFVAGPPIVTFYNHGQRYRRTRVSPDGDRCEWFALSPHLLADVLSACGCWDDTRADAPFAFSHGPSAPDVYLRQRDLVVRLQGQDAPDALEAEETAVRLAERVVSSAFVAWHRAPKQGRGPQRAKQRDMVEHAKEIVLLRFRGDLTLPDIARTVGCSAFHLCRAFKAETGWQLHQFRNQVRLRVALEELRSRRGDLTGLALDLGYSSHSHFTAPPFSARDR